MPMCSLRFNVNLANHQANIDIDKNFIEGSIRVVVKGTIQRLLCQVECMRVYHLCFPGKIGVGVCVMGTKRCAT